MVFEKENLATILTFWMCCKTPSSGEATNLHCPTRCGHLPIFDTTLSMKTYLQSIFLTWAQMTKDDSSYYFSNLWRFACSRSKGFILSSTWENLTLAVTQAASGAAAWEALLAVFGLKDSLCSDKSTSTASLLSEWMLRASKHLKRQ